MAAGHLGLDALHLRLDRLSALLGVREQLFRPVVGNLVELEGLAELSTLPGTPCAAMQTLAQALETTQKLTRTLDEATIESAVEFGLSASLVESLEDMTAVPSLRSLGLSFRWASSGPPPQFGTTPITLDRIAIDSLPYVRERLQRREEPPRRETLIGPVRSLARENTGPNEAEAATIVLAANVRGRTRHVNVTVTGEDHDWAILAYQRKFPFAVTGDLTREGRSWRLHNPIVDEQLLRHYRDERS
jgi:hypothetical protein